jgi:hypothetical protein
MFAILAVAVIILSIQNCQGAPPSADPVYSLPSNRPSDPSLRTIGRGGLGTILEVSGNQDDKNRILDEFAKQKSGRSGQSILYRSLIPEGDESRQFTNFEQIIVVESPVLQLIKPKNPADKRREKTEKRIAEAEKRISDI